MIYSCCNENRKAAVLSATSIAAVSVCAPGSGYIAGDTLTIVQSGSSGTATATVAAVSASGGVTSISLSQNGTGYSVAANIATSGGHGSGCTLSIFNPNGIDYLEVLDSAAVALGLPRQRILVVHCLNPLSLQSGVAIVAINTPGRGHLVGDLLTIAQSGSSGTATVRVTSVSALGGVTGVALSLIGANYSTAMRVATNGGSGSGCTLNILTPLLSAENVLITGGESITGISAVWAVPATAPPQTWTTAQKKYFTSLADAANVLLVQTSSAGDFSPYTFQLVNERVQAAAAEEEGTTALTQMFPGFDPQLAEVQFSFKVECGPNFDCNPPSSSCPLPQPSPPAINYLAKDYGSFRTILLDRLNQLLPTWTGSSEADLGVVLAELIAYVGDYLSYRQDAIATEAYLETARSRISLRRHALLVDYHVHDGCNARVWVCFQVSGNSGEAVFLDRSATTLCTPPPDSSNLPISSGNLEAALLAGAQFFEPMHDALLYPEHGQMPFYAWGDNDCCLPQGSTEATLQGSFPNLHPGDVLIFQENVGPQTGDPADADLRHRCAVRLTQVTTQDANGNMLVDPLFDVNGNPVATSGSAPAAVTEIQWAQADALPFPLCISSTYVDSSGQSHSLPNVSLALGNVVLADHGLSMSGTPLGTVPPPSLYYASQPGGDRCQSQSPAPVPVRFRPQITDSPLTQAVPLPVAFLQASPITGGNPLTSAVVPLGGLIALPDSTGDLVLNLKTSDWAEWPALFGVVVTANASNPGNLDLTVVYNPPRATSASRPQISVEQFTNLSLNSADPNYAPTQVNANSNLIRLAAPAVSVAPSGFPDIPTMLSNTGSVNLQDTSSPPETYLVMSANVSANWLPLFGVQASAAANQAYFNLDVVYDPHSGNPGVALPATIESFDDLSLNASDANYAVTQINAGSALISVPQVPAFSVSAAALTNYDPSDAVPSITLAGALAGVVTTWTAQQDLLESGEFNPVFVVEVESDGTAQLRFGDGTNGQVPDQGTAFTASYRIGNGSAGNVGAESLQLQAGVPEITSVSNPMPAVGGTDPETNDQIRRRAPQAFLTQDRAVTMGDYESMAEQNSQVDQAIATLRWTGSWYTVFIAAQPEGGGNLTTALQSTLQQSLEAYRLAGQDLQLESPEYVSLEIALAVQVDPNYFQADVEQALLAVLGSQMLPNGQKGLFYPDNFTFAQSVYLSSVYAVAQPVPGVVSVMAETFQPQGVNTTQYLDAGEINLGPLQIARLENNPNYPDHGQLTLVMSGGK